MDSPHLAEYVSHMDTFEPVRAYRPGSEEDALQRLLLALKATPIVTLGGKGGAYEFIEARIARLDEQTRAELRERNHG